jgi:TolA-binding protein
VKEQEEKAMQLFTQVLEDTRELTRPDAMPIIKKGFYETIEKYPDSFLAEESYYRLMTINLREVYPPKEEEAEEIYREYFKNYKNPRIGMTMTSDLARFYYDYQRWEKLAKFTTPFMREYVKSGKYGDTVFIFLYTEAKFYLKDYEEARKGYQIMKKNFAGTRNAEMAEKRLEYIKSIQER